jgi:hypothetical protein
MRPRPVFDATWCRQGVISPIAWPALDECENRNSDSRHLQYKMYTQCIDSVSSNGDASLDLDEGMIGALRMSYWATWQKRWSEQAGGCTAASTVLLMRQTSTPLPEDARMGQSRPVAAV